MREACVQAGGDPHVTEAWFAPWTLQLSGSSGPWLRSAVVAPGGHSPSASLRPQLGPGTSHPTLHVYGEVVRKVWPLQSYPALRK